MVLELRQQKKRIIFYWLTPDTQEHDQRNNNDNGNRYLYSLLLKININSKH